jgi:rubredoxin
MNMFLMLKSKMNAASKQPIVQSNYAHTAVLYRKKKNMAKYGCIVCRYIYDPVAGDARQYVHAGTVFQELPEDWCCPECGAGSENFKRLEKGRPGQVSD